MNHSFIYSQSSSFWTSYSQTFGLPFEYTSWSVSGTLGTASGQNDPALEPHSSTFLSVGNSSSSSSSISSEWEIKSNHGP